MSVRMQDANTWRKTYDDGMMWQPLHPQIRDLLAAKQCLVDTVLPFSDQTPLCNFGIELQKL